MALVPVNPSWTNVDIAHLVDNWMVDIDGTQRRMSGRVRAVQVLAEATMHLVAQSPRTTFALARDTDNLPAFYNAADPFHAWRYQDDDRQGRDRTVRILAVPKSSNVSDANCFASVPAAQSNTQSYSFILNTGTNHHWEHYYSEIPIPRGDEANGIIDGAVSTWGAMRILDIAVQDTELFDLDMDLHGGVNMDDARPTRIITSQLVEDTRKSLHDHRTTGMPVDFAWSADSQAGTWNPGDSPGNRLGMTVDADADGADTFVNLLDHAHTSRDANSPGMTAHVYRAGWGREDVVNGQMVKYQWRVHAGMNTSDASNGRFMVEGPIDSGYVNVTANVAAPARYEFAALVHLNSARADDDATAGRNKFDLSAQCHNGRIHILGWTSERVAP